MPTITITGDTTQKALEKVLYRCIGKYGKDFNLIISKNLKFENQNKELEQKAKDDIKVLEELRYNIKWKDLEYQIISEEIDKAIQKINTN